MSSEEIIDIVEPVTLDNPPPEPATEAVTENQELAIVTTCTVIQEGDLAEALTANIDPEPALEQAPEPPKKVPKKATKKAVAKRLAELPKAPSAPKPEPALDPEPEVAAALEPNQCPRCKHVSDGKAFKLGPPVRTPCHGVWNGVEYSIVEVRRIMCQNCHQIHFIKKYK